MSDSIRWQFRIGGMTCVHCQNTIERKLRNTAGIKNVSVSYSTGKAEVIYDSDLITRQNIKKIIEKLDYHILSENEKNGSDLGMQICTIVIIISLYTLLEQFGILNLLVPSRLADTGMGYGMLFVIGLITSVHCIAMCGGIHLSQCIPVKGADGEIRKASAFRPALLYNAGRVVSYTVIGFLLGGLGMLIGGGNSPGLSGMLQGILKLIAGTFMVIMGINMLGIFPWLRRFQPRMPRIFAGKIGQEKIRQNSPFIVGLLNGLMPCGPLQSMQIVALASGNPFSGALSMFLFSLGTVPLMLGLGSVVSALGKKFADKVMQIGAVLVVVLGLAMLSQGGSLSGLFYVPSMIGTSDAFSVDEAEIVDGVQIVNSTLSPGSYPSIKVQAGIPVKWIIDAPEGSINGCNYKIMIRDYGIEYKFQQGENVIEFTPENSGTIQYSCWMGMIRGNIFAAEQNTVRAVSKGENQ